ncbi:MAG TPA: cytochrome C oxidase subunit IV family protein [Chitinophagales bacterium]|nr:cytochrome C oxidase subunit IV family protein [Chitinophagales bacterium]MCB9075368.1 cytochrome C oxidase subunit IV family protein [Chitinophagales bacterium]HMU97436.1 cytochrome C oxidase subunit IV family protein [Chitinophagales bacterium]HMV01973.1 cytochrome C oxidase subunit IV family protein [Chitinophagales bacterium]HMW93382.1 cytochrome C oxidase subunit IV family protein [Chitinophagales bacterium]
MQKSLLFTYIILIVLTILSPLLATYVVVKPIIYIIIIFSVIKFLLVGYQFMELKNAHTFWKAIFTIYACLIGGILMILL